MIKQTQEWLTYHGFSVDIDDVFGPQTKNALIEFQKKHGIPVSGMVDLATLTELEKPIKLVQYLVKDTSLPSALIQVAEQHLALHPIEIGGQNRGPWVRLYCRGVDGAPYAWCCGFVCFCLEQACKSLNIEMPYTYTLSCDNLANQAKNKGKLSTTPTKGGIFLIRKSKNDWIHTGIVVDIVGDNIITIEGNTNDEGSREGFEVAKRTRKITNTDFIKL